MNWFWLLILVTFGFLCSELSVQFALDGRRFFPHKKPLTFFRMLFLWLSDKALSYANRRIALSRMVLSSGAITLILAALYAMLASLLPFRAFTWPLFILAPLYHLTFALFDDNQAIINHSIQQFRLRAVLVLIFGANCWFWHYFSLGITGFLCQSLLSFIALVYFFYLVVAQRTPPSPYKAYERETLVHGPVFIFHYVASSIEGLFYILLFGETFFKKYAAASFAAEYQPYLIFGYILSMYVVLSVLVRLFFFQSSPLPVRFLEAKVLSWSFWLFGASYIFERLI